MLDLRCLINVTWMKIIVSIFDFDSSLALIVSGIICSGIISTLGTSLFELLTMILVVRIKEVIRMLESKLVKYRVMNLMNCLGLIDLLSKLIVP